jgi:hypothetical protein
VSVYIMYYFSFEPATFPSPRDALTGRSLSRQQVGIYPEMGVSLSLSVGVDTSMCRCVIVSIYCLSIERYMARSIFEACS